MGEPERVEIADWLRELPAPRELPVLPPDPDPFRVARQHVRATVPTSYRWAFDEPREESFVTRVNLAGWQEQLEKFASQRWVIFAGAAGSGKTSLAVAALRAAWEIQVSGPDVSEFDVADAKRMMFVHAHRLGVARIQHRAGDGEAPDVAAAMRASVLLLDDVGSERDTANNAVPDVIFERHAEGRDTWITTGLTVPQLKARYGDGVTRRMLERALIVKLGGET